MGGWWDRAPATLQIGNGSLLATFDRMGELDQLFSPQLDALQSKIGAFRTFVLIPEGSGSRMIPISSEEFDVRLRLVSGTQVIQAEYDHRKIPLRLSRTLGLHPKDPLILDSWKVLNTGSGAPSQVAFLHQTVPWIGSSTSAHCSLFHPTFNGLVHHRGRRWLGVLQRNPIHWVKVGHLPDDERRRLWDGERILAPMGAHEIRSYDSHERVTQGWDLVVQGTATWGAMASPVGESCEFFVICAESENHLGELLSQVKEIETQRFFSMIEGFSAKRLAPAMPVLERIENPRVRSLAERSIDVLHALQDARTGALMAAAEVDPHSKVSGGYGYSWPRDGAYLASALGAFGFHDRVEHYLNFLIETQDPSGTWWQRYLASGHAGPSWGRIQIDEPASVIGAAYLHYRSTQDLFWLEKTWPTIERGLKFLENFHGPEHPLGVPSHDLWEERFGIHAYSLGAVAAAFKCGAYLAGELSKHNRETHYLEWNRALSALLTEQFVVGPDKIRRALIGNQWDDTPDVSLLGLITPFGVFRKRDAAAQAILKSVRASLWTPKVGGVMRYVGDHYRGGNPWILTTLWLGIVELSLGHMSEARECFEWSMSKATAQGMLAEQVHKESGDPYWVIPLGWSHAMYLLFVKEVLDRGAEKAIWDSL